MLLVPNWAIERERQRKRVEVIVEGQPQRVYIVLGLSNGTYSEAVTGLEVGEGAIIQTQSPRILEEPREVGRIGGR